MSRAACLLALLPILAGCSDGKSTGTAKDVVHRLDLKAVAKEIGDNRPGAENKYFGMLVEVEVAGLTIKGGDASEIELYVDSLDGRNFPSDGPSTSYGGFFPFSDARNAQLKTIKDGPFRGRVRGYVSKIRDFLPLPNSYQLVLFPAWLEGDLVAGK